MSTPAPTRIISQPSAIPLYPPLRYYTILIRLKESDPNKDYEVRVTGNLDGDVTHDAWVLEKKTDGTKTIRHGCISKVNPQDKLVGKIVYGCAD